MNKKKLSIITVNYNNSAGLEKTINSVIIQKNTDFEFIIIDGASNDDSLQTLKNNKEYIDYYVSEKDLGIYNAMNKGIKIAKGDYLLFLNSGDELYDENALNHIKKNNEDLLYFDAFFYNSTSSFVHQYPNKLNFNYFLKYSLPHQATIINRKLFLKAGLYNENYKICSDWAFFIDVIFKHGASYKKMDKIFSKLNREGISCDPQNFDWIETERADFLQRNYPNNNLIYQEEVLPTRRINIFKKGFYKLF